MANNKQLLLHSALSVVVCVLGAGCWVLGAGCWVLGALQVSISVCVLQYVSSTLVTGEGGCIGATVASDSWSIYGGSWSI